MSVRIVCEECKREWDVERIPSGIRATAKGAPPAPCCQRSLTGGHQVMGEFVTGP